MKDLPDHTFVQLLNENIGIAHKICRVYFSNTDDREDCFQEMMYQLWRSFAGFRGASKFSTWMYQVCLNTAVTYRRKTDRASHQELSEHQFNIGAEDETMEEDIALLFEAIATLTAVNKAIILLYLDNLSYDEIAEVTGLTKSNVSVRLVRIKKELESKLTTLRK